MAQPQNALTPVQPYTPPHLDPISPAIVSRDYWKANPRRDSAREDRHHRRHSPRKEGHDKKRDRSPEGHHHRHHRSDKKRRHSSRHDDYDRHRHRERDRNGDGRRRRRDHASDGKGIGRRPRPEPYVDPGLVPDPLAVSGKAIRISPSKRSSDRSSAVSGTVTESRVSCLLLITSQSVDVANWVRSTSQPVETSLRPSGPLQQVFPVGVFAHQDATLLTVSVHRRISSFILWQLHRGQCKQRPSSRISRSARTRFIVRQTKLKNMTDSVSTQ